MVDRKLYRLKGVKKIGAIDRASTYSHQAFKEVHDVQTTLTCCYLITLYSCRAVHLCCPTGVRSQQAVILKAQNPSRGNHPIPTKKYV